MSELTRFQARLALGFSCLGHTFSHVVAPVFYVAALSLEGEMGLSHGEAISLIVAGNVLFGLAAPVAGWLGDRWSAVGMMALFFLGTGGGMMLTGFAAGPTGIMLCLALTGVFGSIYHPVGIAWLVRNAASRGTALGINGVFGGVGPALAALSAGALIDLSGWRAAFLVPGALMVAGGLLFVFLVLRGLIVESRVDRRVDPPAGRGEAMRVFAVLALTMLCTGLVYQALQPALPKLFSERLADWLGGGASRVGSLVALVYLVAGAAQIIAGRLADLYPLRVVYGLGFALQVPLLCLTGLLGGAGLVVAAIGVASFNVAVLPAENSLVARYAPSHRRGLAFGLKFIIAFGISGLGAKLEAVLHDATGGFLHLFLVLAAVAAVGTLATLLLPGERAAVGQEGRA